ncbi:rRNA pseudouridine synthase [Candidatus Gracilibacteria bacterium]|nr:rRNA pseudouridine synthase [Candidatus Gracilibacteria bacterium]MCF7819789.1 rRNA pseudouridine synthase [Candidatus Gracilibacteria bacterium]
MEKKDIRLQKFFSDQGVCSRRQAEDFICAGKVTVDGKNAHLGQKVSGKESIFLEGKKIIPRKVVSKVIAFFKPLGVECTLSPNRGARTLLDFHFGPERVFPIGRLDKDSHGLLLLTNDGDLGNRLAHPRFGQEKEYLVAVKGNVTPEILNTLSKGILIDKKKTSSCLVETVGENVLRFVLHEGRNRQIRKMCEKVGLQIKDLLRIRVGKIWLKNLKEGEWRILSTGELALLKDTQ